MLLLLFVMQKLNKLFKLLKPIISFNIVFLFRALVFWDIVIYDSFLKIIQIHNCIYRREHISIDILPAV